ncbi:MAG: fused MFS/spermidine synthase [Pirellulales bacterium]
MRQRLLYLLFTLAGVAALIYEVMWTREFRLVFGSSTRSAGAVLAAFFLGMALGNMLGGKLARRSDVVRLYGWTEILLGLTALSVGPWLAAYEAWYPEVYDWTNGHVGVLSAARLLLALVALGPPTIAMGVTLPLMTRAIVTDHDRLARQTGLLYALNILGAVVGVVLAGFFLPLRLGIDGSIYFAVAINLTIGATALLWARAPASRLPALEIANDVPPSAGGRPPISTLVAAAVSGFGTLALEVAYMRILSQRTEASVYSFAIMLVTFLLFLAVGSVWVAWRLDRTDPWRFLARTQLLAVPMILLSPILYQAVQIVGMFGGPETLGGRLMKLSLSTWLLLGPTIVLVGVVLPTTWKIATRQVGAVGEHVGWLTSVNTLAATIGSLTAGFVLLPWLGVVGSVLVVAALYGVVAIMACLHGYQGVRRWLGCAACVTVWVAWLALGPWDLTFQSLAPGEKLLSYRDGEAASVAVVETRTGHRIMKMNHEYILGSSGGADREIRQGRLPLVLHPQPRRVAFIGVATGITAAAALEFPVEKVVAMEIIPGVVDEVDQFAKWNNAFYRDPRVEMVVADGRNHLLGTRERFDVIISDLFVPWHAGTGDLYTREHFQMCHDRLAPGGLFAQWLAGYQLTVEELRSIAASFADAFPVTTLWRNDFDTKLPILCLIGYRESDEAVLDPAKVMQDCQRLAATKSVNAGLLADPAGVEMLFLCGDAELRRWANGAVLNTDDWPYIEYSTPASFFQHRQQELQPLFDLLASFRPRVWPFAEPISSDHLPEKLFRAADLVHDATLAESQKNYVKQSRLLHELVEVAGNVPVVAGFIVDSALGYRQRKMTQRSNELLKAIIHRSPNPVPALLMLSQSMRAEGNEKEAIRLLERANELAPERLDIQHILVELLTTANQFDKAEPYLKHLVETDPDDAALRIELAHNLHRQGKTVEASEQIAVFRALDLGRQRAQLWARLRTYGLGDYVDRP